MILILMGVTGSGKTTVGTLLASENGWEYAEGDDYHSAENVRKMHDGIPLTDEDRGPWLVRLHEVLLGWYQSGKSGVMACSALRQKYRDLLQGGIPPIDLHFVLLEAPEAVLQARVNARIGHYMNPVLLQSQLDTLEIPSDAIRVSVTQPPSESARQIIDQVKDLSARRQ